MDTDYDIEEWATATTRGRHVFNYNYRMTGAELRGWELVKVVTMAQEPGVQEHVYLWQKKDGDGEELLRISIAECSNWRNAHQQLYRQLYHSMRSDIPRGSGKLTTIGDVNFVGHEPETEVVAAISFTRGNMLVSVSSVGDMPFDTANVAKQLDRTFNEPPKATLLKRERAEDTSPKPLSLKANESTTLIENLPEKAAPGKWLKIIAPDGELSQENDTLVYSASKSGKKLIETYVIAQ